MSWISRALFIGFLRSEISVGGFSTSIELKCLITSKKGISAIDRIAKISIFLDSAT